MSEYGQFEWTSPRYEVGTYRLDYTNTKIRLFGDNFEHLNHIEHILPSGQKVGMKVSLDLIDTLMDADFPYEFQKYPDNDTQAWWLNLEDKQLTEDLKEFESHGSQL